MWEWRLKKAETAMSCPDCSLKLNFSFFSASCMVRIVSFRTARYSIHSILIWKTRNDKTERGDEALNALLVASQE
jgi:hypothetical protein